MNGYFGAENSPQVQPYSFQRSSRETLSLEESGTFSTHRMASMTCIIQPPGKATFLEEWERCTYLTGFCGRCNSSSHLHTTCASIRADHHSVALALRDLS